MNSRKITALLLSSAMALSVLTGCGGVNKDKTVATLNGEPVKLGVANFAARFGQAGADDFYTAYFGKNVWTSDLYGNGTTGQDNFKDSVMDSLEDMYVLQLHMDEYNVSITDDEKAAITAAAAQFMEDNSKDAINALGATQEIVEEYLTLETIQSKMKAAIVAGADTNVTDEEAKTGAYSYVGISKTTHQDESGNTVDYTDEEKEELAAKVADFAKAAKEDGLDAAAEDAGYTVSTGTFTQEDDSVDDNLLAALKNLKEGEVKEKEKPKLRWLSILIAYIVAALIITLLVSMVVPQVVSSITMLFTNLPLYISNVQNLLDMLQNRYGLDLSRATEMLDNYESMMNSLTEVLKSSAPQIMAYVSGVASNVVDIFTALASSVYMLAEKDKLLRQLRTMVHAFFPPYIADTVLETCSFANNNFEGFFGGKIIDSAIIGVLTFVCCNIFGIEFAPLIAVVVGVTNIIPVFGPFIGA